MQEDHRTRTARAKRERTRSKIIEAAFQLFDDQGVDRTTVDDVRREAGLARGSFYNYYSTYEDLLANMAAGISLQVNLESTDLFGAVEDLKERLSYNMRYMIKRVSSDKSCAAVVLRAIPLVGVLNTRMREHMEAEAAEMMARGLIRVPDVPISIEIGMGILTSMIRRALFDGLDEKEVDDAAHMLLRAYGVDDTEAAVLAHMPVPEPAGPLRAAIKF